MSVKVNLPIRITVPDRRLNEFELRVAEAPVELLDLTGVGDIVVQATTFEHAKLALECAVEEALEKANTKCSGFSITFQANLEFSIHVENLEDIKGLSNYGR